VGVVEATADVLSSSGPESDRGKRCQEVLEELSKLTLQISEIKVSLSYSRWFRKPRTGTTTTTTNRTTI
jgi:hypothetical protein